MITIRDVARQAGVSVATVSRVLNNSTLVSADTREAVMKAVSELDYRPNANAQALATQVSDTIGVVVMDVSDAFFGALVKAVDLVAQQHQKYVLIGNSYHEAEKERHAIEVLIRQRCNALIVHSKALSDDELAQFMDNIPGMVLINRVVPGYAHRCVCLDNLSGARMATRMLLNNGHQRIGYLSSSHGIEDDAMRKAGWMSALKEQDIIPPESWIGTGTPDMPGGEAAMVELLGRNLQLTAVFAYNDNMAADNAVDHGSRKTDVLFYPPGEFWRTFFCHSQHRVFHHMTIVGNIVAGEHGKRCKAALTAAFQCFDENTRCGNEIGFGGGSLNTLNDIDISGLDPRLKDCVIRVACDVTNPLVGDNGASRIFGPQKGASEAMIVELDNNLSHYAEVIKKALHVDVKDVPGAGAAGGMGAALMAFLGAELKSGIEIVTTALNLEEHIHDCTLVITGEGRIDSQSIHGKVPIGVANVAKKYHKPVIGIAGSLTDDVGVVHQHGIDAVFSVLTSIGTLDEAFRGAYDNICRASRNIAATLAIGMRNAG